jgi:hypothetical protein
MRFNLLLFFLLCYASCVCQTFGDKNAVWIYDHRGGTSFGVTEVTYNKDTLVGDVEVQIFKKTAYIRLSNEVVVFALPPIYIYADDGVVQFSEDLFHFDTLYNFNAEVNESWKIPRRDSDGNETGDFLQRTVLSRFNSKINGIDIPCLEVRNDSDIAPDTICQGIGSRLYYILPFDYLALASDGGEGGLLRCYRSDYLGVVSLPYPWTPFGGTGSWDDGFEYDCDQLSRISSIPLSIKDISVFPNPGSNVIQIQSNKEKISSLAMYNLQGILLFEQKENSKNVQLNIGYLPAGIYFVLINGSYFEKVIVKRR